MSDFDIASLGFSVDTGDIERADQSLDKFERTARKVESTAERTMRTIQTALRTMGQAALALIQQINSLDRAWAALEITQAAVKGGFKGLATEIGEQLALMKKNEDEINKTSRALGVLRTALAAVGIGIGASQLIQYTDQWGMLRQQLVLNIQAGQDLETTWTHLYNISQKTSQSLQGTVELYSRMSRSTKDLALDQNQLLDVVDTINKSLLIARVPAASAEAALLQLSQAFTAGTLRGEELNSVMEQMPVLAEILRDAFGRNLRELASEGELTADRVIAAILGAKDRIDSEFGQVFPTLSNAMARVDNVMVQLIGRADELGGTSEKLGNIIAKFITRLESPAALNGIIAALELLGVALDAAGAAALFFLDNLNLLITGFVIAKVVAGLWELYKVIKAVQVAMFALAAVQPLLALMGVQIGALTRAAAGLGAALAFAAPMAALTAALGALAGIYLLVSTRTSAADDATKGYNDTLVTLGRTADEVSSKIREMTKEQRALEAVKLGETMEKQTEAMADQAEELQKLISGLARYRIRELAGDLLDPQKAEAARRSVEQLGLSLESMGRGGQEAMREMQQRILDVFAAVSRGEMTLTEANKQFQALAAGNKKAGGAMLELVTANQRLVTQHQRSAAMLRFLTGAATEADKATLGLTNTFRGQGENLDKLAEEWGKFIGKLIGARDTLGATKVEIVEYEARAKGFTDEMIRQAVAVQKQTDALDAYKTALEAGAKGQAEEARKAAMKIAEMEASTIRTAYIAAEMARLAPLIAQGLAGIGEVAAVMAQANEMGAAVIEQMTKNLDRIQTNTRVTGSAASKAANQYRDFVQDKERDIAAETALARAYLIGEQAVRTATQARDVENQVAKLGAQHRAEIVRLVEAEAVARDRLSVAQTAANLRQEVTDTQRLAQATLSGQDALARYNIEKEVAEALSGKHTEALGEEKKALQEAAEAAAKARQRLQDIEKLVQLTEQSATAQERYNDRVQELEGLRGLAQTEEQIRAIEIGLQQANDELNEAILQTHPMGEAFMQVARSVNDGLREAFVDAFSEAKNGWKGLLDSFADLFKRLLAQLAFEALAKPILIPVLQGVGGAFGLTPGAVNAGLGQVGLAQAGSSALNLFSGGSGGSAGFAGQPGVPAHMTDIYPGGGGGFLSGASNLFGGPFNRASGFLSNQFGFGPTLSGGLGGAFVGAGIGSLLSGFTGGNPVGGGIGGALGGAAGNLLLPGVGGFIGSALGGVLGGLFGNNEPPNRAQSSVINLQAGTVELEGVTSGDKFSPENRQIAQQLAEQTLTITQALQGLGIGFGGLNLGFEVGDRTGISLRGDIEGEGRVLDVDFDKTEEGIEEAVREALGFILEFAEGLPEGFRDAFDAFQETAERSIEDMIAAVRVLTSPLLDALNVGTSADAMSEVLDIIDLMREESEDFASAGQRASAVIAELVGAETLATIAHQQTVEQLNDMTGRIDELNEALTDAGHEAITSTDQVLAFVSSLDLTTEAGREAAATALSLADAMLQLQAVQESVVNSLRTEDQRRMEALREAGENIALFNDYLDDLGLGAINSRQELLEFTESLDLTTQEGRDAFAAVMLVAESFIALDESGSNLAGQLASFMDGIDNELAKLTLSPFAFEMRRLGIELENNIARARELGASEAELGRIHLLTALQVQQAIVSLQTSVASLVTQLYGGSTSSGSTSSGGGGGGGSGGASDQLAAARELYRQEMRRYQDSMRALEEIDEFIKSVLLSDLTILSPLDQLREAQKQFEDVYARAAAGDTEAQQQVTDAFQTLLTKARDYYASSPEYARIFTEGNERLIALRDQLALLEAPEEPPGASGGGGGGGGGAAGGGSAISIPQEERYRLAVELANQIRDLALAKDQSVFDLIAEMGIGLGALAADLGVNINAVGIDLAGPLRDMAQLLDVGFIELAERLGVDLQRLAQDFGIDIATLDANLARQIKQAADFTGERFLDVARVLGIDIRQLAINLGAPLNELNDQLAQWLLIAAEFSGESIVRITEALGVDLLALAENIGVTVGDNIDDAIRQAAGILGVDYERLRNAVLGLPQGIATATAPLSQQQVNALTGLAASLNTDLAGLQEAVSQLPPEQQATLAPLFGALGDDIGGQIRALIEAIYTDIHYGGGQVLGVLTSIRDALVVGVGGGGQVQPTAVTLADVATRLDRLISGGAQALSHLDRISGEAQQATRYLADLVVLQRNANTATTSQGGSLSDVVAKLNTHTTLLTEIRDGGNGLLSTISGQLGAHTTLLTEIRDGGNGLLAINNNLLSSHSILLTEIRDGGDGLLTINNNLLTEIRNYLATIAGGGGGGGGGSLDTQIFNELTIHTARLTEIRDGGSSVGATMNGHLAAIRQGVNAMAGTSFDVGTAFVPSDMPAQVHRGEIIIDPQSSDVLRRYGIKIGGAAANDDAGAAVVAQLRDNSRQARDDARQITDELAVMRRQVAELRAEQAATREELRRANNQKRYN